MSSWKIGFFIAGLCLGAGNLLPGPAFGQSGAAPAGIDAKPVGRVQTVAGSAKLEHTSAVIVQANLPSTGVEQAKVDDNVYQGDVVVTGADGQIGIVFGDGTSFNVSKNARMEINEFVYDPKGSSNSTLFNLTKGTFTFLAGKAAKSGNMRVETPVGTMGIRGTAPHVEILDDGRVKFSTLIEENKDVKSDQKKPEQKAAPVAPAAERRSPETCTQPRYLPQLLIHKSIAIDLALPHVPEMLGLAARARPA